MATRTSLLWTLTCSLALFTAAALAQDPPSHPRSSLDVAEIESRIKAVQAEALPEAERDALLVTYRRALQDLREADRFTARSERLARLGSEAPQALREARSTLARLTSASPTEASDVSLQEANAKVAATATRLESESAALGKLETELKRRARRRLELATEEIKTQEQLASVKTRLANSGPETPSRKATADRLALVAEHRALVAQGKAQQAERYSYEARRDLLPVRIAIRRRRVALIRSELSAWRTQETIARRASAERAVAEAEVLQRQATTAQSPALQALAARNQALAAIRTGAGGLPARIRAATRRRDATAAGLTELRARFGSLRRKLDAAGLTRAMGRYLRLQLDQLPDTRSLERRLAANRDDISAVQFQLIVWEEEQRKLKEREGEVERLAATAPEAQREAARKVASDLLDDRADLLAAAIEEQSLLLEPLIGQRALTEKLLAATRVYRDYIEERILWVRSVGQSPIAALPAAGPALAWLFASDDWPEALRRTAAEVRSRSTAAVGWLVSIVVIGLLSLTLSRRRLVALCDKPWSGENASLLRTLEALLHVTICALPAPLLVLALGTLLLAPPTQLEIARAVGTGLIVAGATLIVLRPLSVLLRPDGVAETHFRWRSQTTAYVKWHLRWFTPLAATTTLIVGALDHQTHTAWNDSLGLLAFLVEMIAMTIFAQRLVRPSGPVVAPVLQRSADGWIDRLKYLWTACLVGLPLLLGGFALFGFYYSAILLYRSLEATVVLGLGVLIAAGLLNRWLGLIRLRIALADAERRRAERASSEDAEGSQAEVAEGDAAPVVTQDEDRAAFGARGRQLVTSALATALLLGLYLVWSDVLPAFKRLERLQVYPSLAVLPPADDTARLAPLTGIEADPVASPPTASSEPAKEESPATPSPLGPAGSSAEAAPASTGAPARVTAADLTMALLLLAFTILLAKNLPGLVEVAVLHRLPIDAGVRFAIVTVLRYGIAIVGTTATLKTAGIRWDNIQWLAAALTFGLAFGLQEIFANFVSGLIILIERPVRVGDAVTVGDVSGTVTRLQMRATTVTDWDNKELIIPNKEFVTGQVINWSLSSPHLRLRLPIGIVYGSDTEVAERLMLEAAREHPQVLESPSPTAVFLAFGSSTLDFELRVFIPHPKHRFSVRHQLLERINKRFAEAGIEISYPQQDVHLRPTGPLLEALAGSA